MISITTLNEPLNGLTSEELGARIAPLQRDGIDLLCCQSIHQALEHRHSGQIDDSRSLSKVLGLTCSCFAAGRQPEPVNASDNRTLRGLAILTGAGIWVLNSGSFVVGEGESEEVVLFALVRKNGVSVLVFNLHLAVSPEHQEQQLSAIFQHSLLKDSHGAVVLCADRPAMLSSKAWHNMSAMSNYLPKEHLYGPTHSSGLLCLLTDNHGSSTVTVLQPDPNPGGDWGQPQAFFGLTLALDIKRSKGNRRSSRPSFPLSFREQWLGYRDQRAFA